MTAPPAPSAPTAPLAPSASTAPLAPSASTAPPAATASTAPPAATASTGTRRDADRPPLTLRSPADLVAFTPYLLGFHPADSVVVVGFREGQVAFAARSDLPDPDDPVAGAVREIADLTARQAIDAVALLGYGPAGAVDPLLEALPGTVQEYGLRVLEVLRVAGDRWWSYLCGDPGCCPPEGVPVDPAGSEVPAWCGSVGLSPAGSRQELAGRIAPVGGAERAAMTRATDRARQQLRSWLATVRTGGRAAAVLAAGRSALAAALDRYAQQGTLTDEELARLALLLESIPVRDAAWRAITTEQPHLRLWTDLTRRADPPLVPAPASLLAFTAWRSGDGALAGLALERARQQDPSYSMATLLQDALRQGLPPSTLDGWPAVPEKEPGDAPG